MFKKSWVKWALILPPLLLCGAAGIVLALLFPVSSLFFILGLGLVGIAAIGGFVLGIIALWRYGRNRGTSQVQEEEVSRKRLLTPEEEEKEETNMEPIPLQSFSPALEETVTETNPNKPSSYSQIQGNLESMVVTVYQPPLFPRSQEDRSPPHVAFTFRMQVDTFWAKCKETSDQVMKLFGLRRVDPLPQEKKEWPSFLEKELTFEERKVAIQRAESHCEWVGLYAALGLTLYASSREIGSAARKLSRELHPDTNQQGAHWDEKTTRKHTKQRKYVEDARDALLHCKVANPVLKDMLGKVKEMREKDEATVEKTRQVEKHIKEMEEEIERRTQALKHEQPPKEQASTHKSFLSR